MSAEQSHLAQNADNIWRAAWAVESGGALVEVRAGDPEPWIRDGWGLLVKRYISRAVGSRALYQLLEYQGDEAGNHWPALSTVSEDDERIIPHTLRLGADDKVTRMDLRTRQYLPNARISASDEMLKSLKELEGVLRTRAGLGYARVAPLGTAWHRVLKVL